MPAEKVDQPLQPVTEAEITAALAFMARPDTDEGLARTGEAVTSPWTTKCGVAWPYWSRERLTCRYETTVADFYYNPDQTGMDFATDKVDRWLQDSSEPLGGPNGVPDELDAAALAFYDGVWTYRNLGYQDFNHLDVALTDVNVSYSVPYFGFEVIDNIKQVGDPQHGGQIVPGPRPERAYLLWHETFHQFEYEYDVDDVVSAEYAFNQQTTFAWWLEASAEWASHKVAERIDSGAFGAAGQQTVYQRARHGYMAQLKDHLAHPGWALATFVGPLDTAGSDEFAGEQPQYGSFLFAEYLEERFGTAVIRETWEELGRRDSDYDYVAIDRIAGVLADRHAADISEVVRDYHRANYTIAASYRDADADDWVDALDGERPSRTDVATDTSRATEDTVRLGAGGATYFRLGLDPSAAAGQFVTAAFDTSGSPWEVEDLSIQVMQFAGPGSDAAVCAEAPRVAFDQSGHAEQRILLLPDCPEAVVVLSYADPRDIGPSYVSLLATPVSFRFTASQVGAMGLQDDGVEFAAPGHVIDIAGVSGGGHLLSDDGAVSFWGQAPMSGGYPMEATPVAGLGDVREVQAACHGAEVGWAVDAAGRLWRMNTTYGSVVPVPAPVDHLALANCGLVGYLVDEDGSLTYIDDLASTFIPVAGAADVVDVAVWALRAEDGSSGPAGAVHSGYAVTSHGTLRFVDGATASAVPDVDGIVGIAANVGGAAFARSAAGTVVALGIQAPLTPHTLVGITSAARDVVSPFLASEAFVLTDSDQLFVVRCAAGDCSEPAAVDSGLTGVERVAATGNATAANPAWVLLRSGELVELYLDEGGAHARSTGMTDVVDMDISVTNGKYAVHADGTVSAWSRVGLDWGLPVEVSHVTSAEDVTCGYGRCLVNLRD